MTPVTQKPASITLTPKQGCMAIGEWLTRFIEAKTGMPLWDGENGVKGVLAEKLNEWNVPETMQIEPPTPRSLAESTGIVKRHKRRAKR